MFSGSDEYLGTFCILYIQVLYTLYALLSLYLKNFTRIGINPAQLQYGITELAYPNRTRMPSY